MTFHERLDKALKETSLKYRTWRAAPGTLSTYSQKLPGKIDDPQTKPQLPPSQLPSFDPNKWVYTSDLFQVGCDKCHHRAKLAAKNAKKETLQNAQNSLQKMLKKKHYKML